MPYVIKVWIPVEPDDFTVYKTRAEAKRDYEHFTLMQPENIYRIARIGPPEDSREKGSKGKRR
jgi:hypothetical protein